MVSWDHQNITVNRSVTLEERCGLGLCWQQNRAHGSTYMYDFLDLLGSLTCFELVLNFGKVAEVSPVE